MRFEFLSKQADEHSLLCTGKLIIDSHEVTTPVRVYALTSLRQLRLLIKLLDNYKDLTKFLRAVPPLIELHTEITAFRGKRIQAFESKIREIRRRLNAKVFIIPHLDSKATEKVIRHLREERRDIDFAYLLSSYAEVSDILTVPLLKITRYDRSTKRSEYLVSIDDYINYLNYTLRYLAERIDKPCFVPIPRFSDQDLGKLMKYVIERKITYLLLDYDGTSYKRLTPLVRVIQTEYQHEELLNKLVLYGTRILREAVPRRNVDEVKFADILALVGLDILGVNYKKVPPLDEEGLPIKSFQEPIERYLNNETYGYRHEKFLKEEEPELHDILTQLRTDEKKLFVTILNTLRHEKECEKYVKILEKKDSISEYLKEKKFVQDEDLQSVRRRFKYRSLDEFLDNKS